MAFFCSIATIINKGGRQLETAILSKYNHLQNYFQQDFANENKCPQKDKAKKDLSWWTAEMVGL